ncbi:MAG: cbb3-type cytochrome oxidase assembly protein CcoS [Gammaproteobacteria bacterium]|nr:MAG: cbb3-type cytochrome oxidase assembly protein CcoS [Gammaproteobacteria bacterium]
MEVLFLILPVSLVLIGGIAWAFLWAVKSGQFDDLEGPAHRILMDDDSSAPVSPSPDTRDEPKDS